MLVTVKLFATLTKFRAGAQAGKPFEIDLPEGAVMQDLVELLQIPPKEVHIVFINSIIQHHDVMLNENDVIGIFPPVGGG